MKKVAIYSLLGKIFITLGIIASIGEISKEITSAMKYFHSTPIRIVTFSLLFGILMAFAGNIYLWAGAIFYWRVDKNESLNKASKWIKIIKAYFIFTMIMLLFSAFFVAIPNWLRNKVPFGT